jgi:hypothetical protein
LGAASLPLLDPSEYVEQGHFFRTLAERLPEQMPLQDLLAALKHELLVSTRLPMAVDFLLTELRHSGLVSPAMRRLSHYFTSYQSYLMEEAESDSGQFDMRMAVTILRAEAEYRATGATAPGMFLFQFETLSRNRLRYAPGLKAISEDPLYSPAWRDFILDVRNQIGLVDFADLLYLRSEDYLRKRQEAKMETAHLPVALFGEKEGRIALANRRKDPAFLFSALQRHLGFPAVPRPVPPDPNKELVPLLQRRLERLEARMKLFEEENRQGAIDITKFYTGPSGS